MKTLRVLTLAVAAGALVVAVSCSPDDGGSNNTKQEICNNGVDDDGDGYTDCDDSECASDSNCATLCGDGVCDAGETQVSCPADCAPAEICNNQMDDDGDGFTDCQDSDCANDPACQTPTEDCTNGVDDDGDGFTDCDDSDCTADPACQATGDELSCVALNQCYSCCGQDQSCYSACDAQASATATSQMDAFYACVQNSCATECGQQGNQTDCQNCVDQNCQAEADACDWGGTGTTGCMSTFVCLVGDGQSQTGCPQPAQSGTATTCPSDPGLLCYQDCFAATDQTSIDMLFAMNDCLIAATDTGGACESQCANPQSQECSTCIQNACSTEIQACQTDG